MARPISSNQLKAVEIIKAQMAVNTETKRKEMLELLVNGLGITKANAGYYLDRACKHIYVAGKQVSFEITTPVVQVEVTPVKTDENMVVIDEQHQDVEIDASSEFIRLNADLVEDQPTV